MTVLAGCNYRKVNYFARIFWINFLGLSEQLAHHCDSRSRIWKMKLFQRIRLWTPFKRSITTTPAKRSGDHHDEGGIPGKNLPFSIKSHRLLALKMGLYMGSGFSVPFVLLRHQLKKKNDA